jgi:hypothetical protein
VLLDSEHSGVGIETIKMQIAASRGLGIVPMVRVPGCHYHLIAPVLDAGAMGIMVPMVETAAQAGHIASWCRYRPEGVRGVAFGMPHDDYRRRQCRAKAARGQRAHSRHRLDRDRRRHTREPPRTADSPVEEEGFEPSVPEKARLVNTMAARSRWFRNGLNNQTWWRPAARQRGLP